MNPTLVKLMRNYHHYHSKALTVYSHFIGIPAVTFAMIIFFSWFQLLLFPLLSINLAWLAIIGLGVFYIKLDRAIGMATVGLLIVLGIMAFKVSPYGLTNRSFIIFLITFVTGWAFQLLGHALEGKKPALLDSFFASVFIAPLFMVAEIFFRLGWKKALQAAIQ